MILKFVNGQPTCTSLSRFTHFQKEYLLSNMGIHLTCIHTAESYFNKEKPGLFPLWMSSWKEHAVSIVKSEWQSCFRLLLLFFLVIFFSPPEKAPLHLLA